MARSILSLLLIQFALQTSDGTQCVAATSHERALAAVAVARAALDLADQNPVLPDRIDSALSQASPQPVTPPVRVNPVLRNSSPNGPHEADIPGKDAHDATATSVVTSAIRMELIQDQLRAETLPAQLVIGHWEQGCAPCLRLKNDITTLLTPLGWQIGKQDTDQIRFVLVPTSQAVPQITLYQNGRVLRTWNQYTDPAELSRQLRAAWDDAPPSIQDTVAEGQPASLGTIHARTQIKELIRWWRNHLGEGTRATFSWDRTGAQQFPLLAKGDWTAVALFGKSGRIEISAPGAASIPVDSFGFAYRLVGEDIVFDLDPVTIKGLALRLGPATPAGSPTPSQIDPMTAWTVVSIIRSVWSLLHPTCDLQLGCNVSATAVVRNNALTIDFQQCPSIKLVALFTFQLRVDRVELTESSVRVLFGGSRLVKERTFVVQ